MKSTYTKALSFVLESEGGFSDDPGDSGGPTMKGITWSDIAAYRKKPVSAFSSHASQVRLAKSLTDEELGTIYSQKYWAENLCDDLPFPLDMIVFDTAVNCGYQGARLLWRATGQQPLRVVTAALLAIIRNEGAHLPTVVENYLDLRIAYYHAIAHGHNAKFLKGWLARVDHLRTAVEVKP